MKTSIFRHVKSILSVFAILCSLSLLLDTNDNTFINGAIAQEKSPSAIGFTKEHPLIQKVIGVQNKYSKGLMKVQGVLGSGVGLGSDGQPIIKIYLERAGISNMPVDLDGIPVKLEVTGMIIAFTDPTMRQSRPVPIGVSTGHPDITAGTIGARVVDSAGNVYALSNNHVYANSNDASIWDNILQPGTYDGGTESSDVIGQLFDFEAIDFNGGVNKMDAAIALSSIYDLSNATPSDDGYGTPSSTSAPAILDQPVQKYGRTTLRTYGTVDTVNVRVEVCYEVQCNPVFCNCKKSAIFDDQFSVTDNDSNDITTFSAGGDSGSLIVTNDGNNYPVGLLFAGGGGTTFANPIDPILTRFNVVIDDSTGITNYPPTAEFTFSTDVLTTTFTDASSDSDGYIDSWSWDFGDGNTSGDQSPSHTYASGGTYTVTLTVTDNEGATDNSTQAVAVSDGTPTADFSFTTTGLTATFTDNSSDSDGSIVSWSWEFGDGNTSGDQSPSHTYASGGTYIVTLTVTDNDSKTNSLTKDVTVSDVSCNFELTATGYKVKGRQKAELTWNTCAASGSVDIFRDGDPVAPNEANDGSYLDNINNVGGGSYSYQVCEDDTSNCSNVSVVSF